MRKATLASLATLLLTATGASANPWANYDWSTGSFSDPFGGYRAPAYPNEQPMIQAAPSAFNQPVMQQQQAAPAQTAEATQVNYSQISHQYVMPPATSGPACNCQSERYSMQPMMTAPAPQMQYQPAPQMQYSAAPQMSYGGPSYGGPVQYGESVGDPGYLNPAYVGNECNNYDVGYGMCGVSPSRSYTINVRAEALFFNRVDNFNDSRFILDGPNPLTLNDVAGDGSATAWRIGADLLFGDPCSDWQHGVGFVYGNYGNFYTSNTGTLPLGIAFDANTKNVPGVVNTSCFFIDQTTFFASLARVASANSDQTNEQEELEGLGPDPLPGSGSENFALPTYRVDYESDLDTIGVDFIVARKTRRIRLGVGWRQWNLNESSFVGITGPLHATDLSFANGLPRRPDTINNGLEHNAFVYAGTGNGSDPGYTYIGPVGAEDGFDGQEVDPITGAAVDNNGQTDGVGPDTIEMLSTQRATNTLNGINFSAAGQLFCYNRFDLYGGMNLGVYHNHAEGVVAERITELTGNGSAYGRGFTDSQDVVSFVGSTSLEAGYWVTNWARLYGGYEVVFINGVALSPEQEAGMSGNAYMLKHDGDLILHGAKVGMEFLY